MRACEVRELPNAKMLDARAALDHDVRGLVPHAGELETQLAEIARHLARLPHAFDFYAVRIERHDCRNAEGLQRLRERARCDDERAPRTKDALSEHFCAAAAHVFVLLEVARIVPRQPRTHRHMDDFFQSAQRARRANSPAAAQ